MKKTIVALFALAGIASADTQYFDFGNMRAGDAISIATSQASGDLTALTGSYSFTSDRNITCSQTTSDKNTWCDPFTGILPNVFSDANYADALTTQGQNEESGMFTLTLSGLKNGVYSLDIFGGFVGKDQLAQVTLTIACGGQSVEWTNVMGTDLDGEWSAEGCTISDKSATITTIDYTNTTNADGNPNWSDYTTMPKGYLAQATNIEVTDGTLTLTVKGNGQNNSWSRNAVNGVAIQMVPEPTTATLSLLALAGLAARRRRK